MVRVLPDGCGQERLRGHRLLAVVAAVQVGQTPAQHEDRPVDRGPLLRAVPSKTARPLGLRRPGDRCLPAETVVDADPSSPDGQGRRVPGRPGTDRLLAPATQAASPATRHTGTAAPLPTTPTGTCLSRMR